MSGLVVLLGAAMMLVITHGNAQGGAGNSISKSVSSPPDQSGVLKFDNPVAETPVNNHEKQNDPARIIQSLNGSWQILFDSTNVGEKRQWFRQEEFTRNKQVQPIEVPSAWEEINEDYEGVAWYGKRFEVPDDWNGQTVRIQFDAVNYRAELWINGEPVDYHDGGYTPFEFEIDDFLDYEGENFLALRVISPIVTDTTKEVDGIGKDEAPHWRGGLTAGIWQSVRLVATGNTYIDDMFAEPDIQENRAILHGSFRHTRMSEKEMRVELSILDKNDTPKKVAGATQKIDIKPGLNELNVSLDIENPELWSPEHPHLYTVVAKIYDGETLNDVDTTHFGMREFTIKDEKFYLNGEEFYLKCAFWEGAYPRTQSYPQNAEMVREEIQITREAGFNCLRPWRRPAPPPTLDLADEMGMLFIDSPPVECMRQWPKMVPQVKERIANEMRSMVLRDRNHPSVIYWELFNEIARAPLKYMKGDMVQLVRDLDPSRLIVDESGGWTGANAYLPHSYEPFKINEVHNYKRSPVDENIYNSFLYLGRKSKEQLQAMGIDNPVASPSQFASERLTFVSEIGYGGMPDLPAVMKQFRKEGNPLLPDYRVHQKLLDGFREKMKESGLDGIFEDVSDLSMASQELQAVGNKLQLEATRLNPEISGYAVHALTGGNWVVGAGILDIWRNPKKTYESIKKVQQPVYLPIKVTPSNAYADRPIELNVKIINDHPRQKGVLITLIRDASGREIYNKQVQVDVPKGIHTLLEANLADDLRSGTYEVEATLQSSTTEVADNTFEFRVFEEESPMIRDRIDLLDPKGSLTTYLEKRKIEHSEFEISRDSEVPVIVTPERPADEAMFEEMAHVLDYVERGGVAIFLNPPRIELESDWTTTYKPADNPLITTGLFPYKLKDHWAAGQWWPVIHAVHDHPIFEGLPNNDYMGQAYKNVIPDYSFVGEDIRSYKPVAASISWQYQTDYRGIDHVWWGSDVIVLPHGKGKIIVSNLDLVNNLDKDPVADKLLHNLINYANKIMQTPEPVDPKSRQDISKYLEAYRELE